MMTVRLSELLERIRPAGAPGAPADARPQRERAALDEIAEIAALLVDFEAEADAVVAEAHEHAATIRAGAKRTAQEIRAGTPDRVAAARAGWTAADEARTDTIAEQIAVDAGAEVAALWEQADIDRVVDEAVASLWQLSGGAR